MSYPPPPYVPGPTSQPMAPVPPQPPRHRRELLIALACLAVAFFLCLVGVVIIGVTHENDKPASAARTTDAPAPADSCADGTCTTATPVAEAPGGPVLTAADIELTVKIKKKDCFGSAGCNVEYEIDASVGKEVQRECEVTYDVHGLEDTRTGTLDFHRDGTFEQDKYQAGETSSSTKKLTAKVTDVEC